MKINLLSDIAENINSNTCIHNYIIQYYGNFDLIGQLNIENKKRDDSIVIIYSFEKSFMSNPFEPFLDFIKECIREKIENIDDFLVKMKVVENLKPVFKHYFLDNNAYRNERMWECVEYEKNNIYSVLENMLSFFSTDTNIIFILDNLHRAPVSTIKLIKKIINNINNRIYLVAGFDYLYPVQKYKVEIWNNFISELDVDGYLIDFETNCEISDSDIEKYFDKNKINEYLLRTSNSLELLELEDAIYQLEYMHNKVIIEKNKIDSDEEFKLYELFAYAYTLCNRHNDTLLICDSMKINYEAEYSEYKAFIYDYYKGRAHLILGQQKNALEFMNDALIHATNENNEFHIMLSKMMLIIIKYSPYVHDTTYKKTLDESVLNLMYKFKFYNHIIIITCICAENDKEYYESKEVIETKAECFIKVVDMAQKLDNKRILCSIYRYFIAKSANANYHNANKYFHKKYLEIIEKGTKDEMYIQIGMGYLYFVEEQYQKAQDYFLISLQSSIELCSVSHMAEIMYNMSMNAFLAQNYDISIKYSNICIWIMEKMSYTKLFVCNIAKLHAIKALCYYRQNRKYLSSLEHQIIYRNIEFDYEGLDKTLNMQDLFFYYYIGALLYSDNKDYEKAKIYFTNAEEYLLQLDSQFYFNYVPFMLDKAYLYKEIGDYKKEEDIINKALLYCEENGYTHKKEMINCYQNNIMYLSNNKYNLELPNETYIKMKSSVNYQNMEKKIARESDEKEFLSNWQKIMSNSLESVDVLTKDSFDAFIHHYNVDAIVVLRCIDDKFQIYYTGEVNFDFINHNASEIYDFFINHKKEFIINSTDRHYDEYRKLFELYGCNKVYSAFGASFYEKNKLEYMVFSYKLLNSINVIISSGEYQTIVADNLSVYMRLFRQMIDTINRIENILIINEINRQLSYYAQTDRLTGILNRAGLYEKINSLLVSNTEETKYSILYIDLDNFKYYNDTFGHEIGDIVLIKFSGILNTICIKSGLAVRYGGDEFLVIFENISESVLINNIENIYKTVETKNYFLEDIANKLGKEVTIEEKHRISCSIGVCNVNINYNSNMATFEDAINKADSVLYDVKRTTKGKYKFYLEEETD